MRAMHLGNVAFGVFGKTLAFDNVSALEPNHITHRQAEELLRRFFHKVLALYPQLAAERKLAAAVATLCFRIVLAVEYLGFIFRVIGDDQFCRVQRGHAAPGSFVQILAAAGFQQGNLDHILALRYTTALTEIANSSRRITAAAQSADGRHAL